MRRVENRCGRSKAYSPAWVTGPQRRVSPVTGRTYWEWQYQQPSLMYTRSAALLQRRVVGRVVLHPLELAQVGAHHLGHLGAARLRFQHGQDALDEGGERDAAEPGHQGVEAQSVAALAHDGATFRDGASGTRDAPPARSPQPRESTVRIRL